MQHNDLTILHQEIDSYLLRPCEQFLDAAKTFVCLFFPYAFFDQVIKICQPPLQLLGKPVEYFSVLPNVVY